jgi:hypothetical protein
MNRKMKRILAIISVIFFMNSLYVYADPPEDRGRGQNQGNAYGRNDQRNNRNGQGTASRERARSNNASARNNQADRARSNNASNHINQAEIHRRNLVQTELRTTRRRNLVLAEEVNQEVENSSETSRRNETRIAHGLNSPRSAGGVSNEVLLARLDDVLNSLRAQERARWSHNPVDERPQGNSGRPEMRDPYGFARDERLEATGNRGRPIHMREEGIYEVSPLTYTSTDYIYTDFYTYWAHYLDSLGYSSSWINFESLGYTQEEIAFLQTLSTQETYEGMLTGYVVGPTQELPILSAEQTGVDLSRLINYADAYQFIYMPGDTVEYEISLTNPYDTELTLSVAATIEYMNNSWVYNPDVGTYQRRHLVGTPVQGESTEVWETVTIAPAETITLYDTYYMPLEAYWSNYQFDVTLVDLSSGTSYNNPAAGWFDPPLNLAEAHRHNR